MVASIGSSTGGVAKMADAIFSRLDTKNQGFIDKAGLQDALAAAGDGSANTSADDAMQALDGDVDGKVTKSELTEAMTKLSDQLNAQFDASRVGRGGGPGGMPPKGPPPAGAGGTPDATDATQSTTTTYNAAADTDGDGTVSTDEEAAYAKLQASGGADGAQAGTGANNSTGETDRPRDPMRELAHALHLLKAYTDGADTDTDTGNGTSITA